MNKMEKTGAMGEKKKSHAARKGCLPLNFTGLFKRKANLQKKNKKPVVVSRRKREDEETDSSESTEWSVEDTEATENATPELKLKQVETRLTEQGETETMIGPYQVVSLIGKGSFGKVFLTQQDGHAYAIKMLDKDKLMSPRKVRLVMDEKFVMTACEGHPFILSLHHAFQTADYLCLVSEFCSGGELFYHLDKAGRFNEAQVRFYCSEIAAALCFLHSRGIAYRDLKCENILLDELGHIRLADFGLAAPNVSELRGAHSICGTPSYIAPEMIRLGGKSNSGYGFSVDYWSLGTLIYDVLCGQPPFYHQSMELMCEHILKNPLTFPSNIVLSLEAKDLMRQLLARDPEARLGSSRQGGFTGLAKHPFFASIDWENIEASSKKPASIILSSDANANQEDGRCKFSIKNFHSDFTSCCVEENLGLNRPETCATISPTPLIHPAPVATKAKKAKKASKKRKDNKDQRAASAPAACFRVPNFSEWDYVPQPSSTATAGAAFTCISNESATTLPDSAATTIITDSPATTPVSDSAPSSSAQPAAVQLLVAN